MKLKDILAALESFYRHRVEPEALEYVASLQDMMRESAISDTVLALKFTGRYEQVSGGSDRGNKSI